MNKNLNILVDESLDSQASAFLAKTLGDENGFECRVAHRFLQLDRRSLTCGNRVFILVLHHDDLEHNVVGDCERRWPEDIRQRGRGTEQEATMNPSHGELLNA